MATLTVVIPCYNEHATLQTCVEHVVAAATGTLSIEVIIVDDCSGDGSRELARELCNRWPNVKLLCHECNRGKGAALRTGFAAASGDYVIVQDADLEYDPTEYPLLVQPIVQGKADVVVGSRFLTAGPHRVLYFWHTVGNRALTLFSNIMTDLNLTDMECGYKVFRREVIQSLELHEDRFGFEPEVIAQVAHRRLRIYEVGVSYYGRSYSDGKKIGLRDAVRAAYCILKYNLPILSRGDWQSRTPG